MKFLIVIILVVQDINFDFSGIVVNGGFTQYHFKEKLMYFNIACQVDQIKTYQLFKQNIDEL